MTSINRLNLGTALLSTLMVLQFSQPAAAQAQGPVYTVPQINVIGVTPVQGSGIERERLPANIITIDRNAIKESGGATVVDTLDLTAPSVSRVDSQNNPFQPNVNVRGFTASPLLGEPQGLAIYQNGVRINEPFGDIVQWDLFPDFAVNRLQIIQGTNPIYGLNAIGGAITADMNNGFNFKGLNFSLEGGSFGRVDGSAEYGGQSGKLGFYAGVRGVRENGWRDVSPSKLFQSYFDVAARGDIYDIGASMTFIKSDLTGNGPAPEELLAQRRGALFTTPDITRNTLVMLALRGNIEATEALSFQANSYFRHNKRNTVNGDATGNGPCEGNIGFLCSDPGPDQEQLEDIDGNPISSALIGSGALNRQRIITNGVGGSLQATFERPVFGLRNTLIVGNSLDAGWTDFSSNSELGVVNANSVRSVSGLGLFLGTEDFNTGLKAQNVYYGLYLSDTLALTERLNFTAGVRFNLAFLELQDQLGTALNGSHQYQRANPSFGLTYQLTPAINAYGVYAEANRIPTPAELACADPTQPCRFPNAFLSDPPLKQVVSRSFEAGLRGRHTLDDQGGGLAWTLSAFRTRNQDDIIFVSAGPVVGSGFFQNAGTTQRLGVEAGLNGALGRWSFYANYSFVHATFESPLTILSPDNPAADADGNIFIKPGDRIPSIPQHSVKLGLGYGITDAWKVGVEAVINSSRFLRGDESNQQKPVDGFAIFNLTSNYKITENFDAKLRINNIFNTKYETFGLYADPTEVFPGFTSNRFLGPGAPLGIWAGVTATF